ncbi:MAG: hypothetical protein CMK64_15140 [Pseudoalteromonas sp.]|nr:hypothetical protein [Pseudoalteromonas sp.]|tara:strand:- start:436 stop:1389 length:954 start_codon:yes stop_codon:yes gene_type:complete
MEHKFYISTKSRELLSDEARKSKLALMSWLTFTLLIAVFKDAELDSLFFLKFTSEDNYYVGDLLWGFAVISLYNIINYGLTFYNSHKAFKLGVLADYSGGNILSISFSESERYDEVKSKIISLKNLLASDCEPPTQIEKLENNKIIDDNLLRNLTNKITTANIFINQDEDKINPLCDSMHKLNHLIRNDKTFDKAKASELIQLAQEQLNDLNKVKAIKSMSQLGEIHQEIIFESNLLDEKKSKYALQLEQLESSLNSYSAEYRQNINFFKKYFESSSYKASQLLFLSKTEIFLFIVIPIFYALVVTIYVLFAFQSHY